MWKEGSIRGRTPARGDRQAQAPSSSGRRTPPARAPPSSFPLDSRSSCAGARPPRPASRRARPPRSSRRAPCHRDVPRSADTPATGCRPPRRRILPEYRSRRRSAAAPRAALPPEPAGRRKIARPRRQSSCRSLHPPVRHGRKKRARSIGAPQDLRSLVALHEPIDFHLMNTKQSTVPLYHLGLTSKTAISY